MLAFSQHNLGLCGGQRPPNWASGPVKGLSAQILGLRPSVLAIGPMGEGGRTNTHTFCKYILV